MKNTHHTCCDSYRRVGMDRRSLLRAGSLSLLGFGLSDWFRARDVMAAKGLQAEFNRSRAQSCILVFLKGAPSQVDSWDPKPTSSFRAISTRTDGVQISELLPRVARHMDKLSLIRSMHSEEIDHPEAIHYAITGHRQNPALKFPSLGSMIARELGSNNRIPPYVNVPNTNSYHFGSAFLGPEYEPLQIPKPEEGDFRLPDLSLPEDIPMERIEDRRSFQEVVTRLYRRKRPLAEMDSLDKYSAQALEMILSPEVKRAFDLSQESDGTRDTYGRNGFGQSFLLSRRLVEAGCRFVTATGGFDWDTHSNHDESIRDEGMPPFDQSLAALMEDLDQRGLLESTIVAVMGEFGRTTHFNPDGGRDHWPGCWSMAIGGGGIKGGQVVGASDEKGAYIADRLISIGDLHATIYKAMGIDWTKEIMSPLGRPVKLANALDDQTGVPIHELI